MPQEQPKYVRFDRLKVVCSKALEESQKVLTDENLYSCYPSLAATDDDKQLIKTVKDQLTESWRANTLAELNLIYQERDIEAKLNQLDELIADAQIRQKQAHKEPTVHIDQLTPSTILASHLLPIKEQNLKNLQNQLIDLQNGNLELFNELNGLLTESRRLKSDVSTSLNSIKTLNELANDKGLDDKLNALIQITRAQEDN